jgi:hypothetical protein
MNIFNLLQNVEEEVKRLRLEIRTSQSYLKTIYNLKGKLSRRQWEDIVGGVENRLLFKIDKE